MRTEIRTYMFTIRSILKNIHYARLGLIAPLEKKKEICVDVEHAKCGICLSIWHDVVTLAPCLHNFCNGCFSEWPQRSKEKCLTEICWRVCQWIANLQNYHGFLEFRNVGSFGESGSHLLQHDAKSPLLQILLCRGLIHQVCNSRLCLLQQAPFGNNFYKRSQVVAADILDAQFGTGGAQLCTNHALD